MKWQVNTDTDQKDPKQLEKQLENIDQVLETIQGDLAKGMKALEKVMEKVQAIAIYEQSETMKSTLKQAASCNQQAHIAHEKVLVAGPKHS